MKYAQQLCIMLLLVAALAGCQQTTQGPEPLPELTIGLAQFTQPTNTWDLLAGYIPENQPTLDSLILRDLDATYETLLFRQTNRRIISSGTSTRCLEMGVSKSGSSSTSLAKWVSVGKCMNVDLLIVPQILAWTDRDGGDMGTFHPAAVTMDIFIIDIKKERAISRFHFDETQESLSNNLMNFGKFVDRKGKWITARQLAEEGLNKSVKELGL